MVVNKAVTMAGDLDPRLDKMTVVDGGTGALAGRGFAGIGCSFDRHARLEVGYLNQLIQAFVRTRTVRRTDLRVNHRRASF